MMAAGARARTADTLLMSGVLSPRTNRLQSERLVLIARRKGEVSFQGRGSVKKLKDKVQNQKCQLAAMHAAAKSASKYVGGDAMDSDSGSDGDQRKHSALTRQGRVPRKFRHSSQGRGQQELICDASFI